LHYGTLYLQWVTVGAGSSMQHERDIQPVSPAKEWGLPDWLDGGSYGYTESWNENRWRWEFTRRREDYRADFDRYAEPTYVRAIELYKTFKPDGRLVAPDQILKPTDPGFTATMPGPMKYGLAGLPNPRISEQPFYVRMFQPTYGAATLGEGPEFLAGGEGVSVDAPDGTVAIVFDLAQPIKPQLQGLQSRLELEQELRHGKVVPGRRKHPRTWLRYLRVLDGRECGATFAEIAEVAVVETEDTAPTPPAAKVVWDAARALMFNWPA